jgi:hypothetical protein
MNVKNIIRPMPGARRLSNLRQRIEFSGSAGFWEQRYASGGTSGDGSYGTLAYKKAELLNAFVQERGILSVIEFGCGDGNQLSLAEYPQYIGLDVSRTAIKMCVNQFADDAGKSFFLYDGSCFADREARLTADLAISLDVVYHLIEDATFEAYMTHLFAAAERYVIIYATNESLPRSAPHVRHRAFTSWVEANCGSWRLIEVHQGPSAESSRADFFIYERSR